MPPELICNESVLILETFEEMAVAIRAIHRQFEDVNNANSYTSHHLITPEGEGNTLLGAIATLDEERHVQPAVFSGQDRNDIVSALYNTPVAHFDHRKAQDMLAAAATSQHVTPLAVVRPHVAA